MIQQAIELYTQLLDAWNRRDAKAFAAGFTPTGIAIGFDGSQMTGRVAIEAELARVFADHETASYVAKVRTVVRVSRDGVLVHAVAGMAPRGASALNPATNAVQTIVAIREGDALHIALLQNTPAALHGRPELVEQLTAELTEVLRSGAIVSSKQATITHAG